MLFVEYSASMSKKAAVGNTNYTYFSRYVMSINVYKLKPYKLTISEVDIIVQRL